MNSPPKICFDYFIVYVFRYLKTLIIQNSIKSNDIQQKNQRNPMKSNKIWQNPMKFIKSNNIQQNSMKIWQNPTKFIKSNSIQWNLTKSNEKSSNPPIICSENSMKFIKIQ